jgi:cyanophycinase
MFSEPREVLTLMIDGANRQAVGRSDISRGLGLIGAGESMLERVLVDQHFVKRGRIGRALAVLAQEQIGVAIGVEEDSGAVFRGEIVEVIGSRGVLVADIRGASVSLARPLRLQNARLHWLTQGDQFNIKTGEVHVAPSKSPVKTFDHSAPNFSPYYESVRFTADVLSDGIMLDVMNTLVDAKPTETRGIVFAPGVLNRTGFEFHFFKVPTTRGVLARSVVPRSGASLGGTSGRAETERMSVINMGINVMPIRMSDPLYTAWQPAAQAEPQGLSPRAPQSQPPSESRK